MDGSGGRLEVANNVGRPEQDAFTGSLSSAAVRYSHKHPSLCTITVDAHRRHSSVAPHPDDPEWRLPGGDPRHEWRYLTRLHTVDLYFWTDDDAKSFIKCIEKTLRPHQIQILDAPAPPTTQDHGAGSGMSHVVQRLENAAISDGGQQRASTATSVSPATPASIPATMRRGHSSPKAEDTTNYQPLAYNPAAPAAPEPIAHREKTPPPVDADPGTGLSAAAHRDHTQSISPMAMGNPQPNQAGNSLPPSAQWLGASSTAAGPRVGSVSSIPSATGQRAPSISSVPSAVGPAGSTPFPSGTPMGNNTQRHGSTVSAGPQPGGMAFAPPPTQPSERPSSGLPAQTHGMSFAPPPQDPDAYHQGDTGQPMATPTAEILGGSYVGSPPQPLQHLQPRYADYLQSHSPAQQHGARHDYDPRDQRTHGHHMHRTDTDASDIHNQHYVPDEHEGKHHRPSDASSQSKISRVDKLGNKFLKKLEKNFG